MPNILFNMPSQHGGKPSGVARVAFDLLSNLIGKSEFDYALRSPWTREQLPDALQSARLKVFTVERPPRLVTDVLWQTLTFPLYCRRNDIDLVVNMDPFGSASGGRSRLMIVHDLYFKTIGEQIGPRAIFTNDLIFKLMLMGNATVITVSDATKRDLEMFYPSARGRATTIHSASSFTPLDLNATVEREIEGRYVIAVGNATENKNFEILAEAMEKVHRAFGDVSLVHVGADSADVIATSLRKLGSNLKLIRFSNIDDRRLAALYHHASCLCVTSIYEGFCLPVIEAQRSGCPVVCSNKSAVPEIAGTGALLFDPTDSDAVAESIKKVLSSPDISEMLVRKGRDNAARFSWDATARKYENVFRSLLRGNTALPRAPQLSDDR